jgi:hypothetical protein
MQTLDYDGKCIKVGDDITYRLECDGVRRWEFAKIWHIDKGKNIIIRRYRYDKLSILLNGIPAWRFVPIVNKELCLHMFILTRCKFSPRGVYSVQTESILLDPNNDEDKTEVVSIHLYDKDGSYTLYQKLISYKNDYSEEEDEC